MTIEQPSVQPKQMGSTIVSAGIRVPTLLALLHTGFILTGIVNTMLGPLLPLLSSRWTLSDVGAGNLFVAQFLGSMAGVTASSLLVPRRGPRFVLALGLCAMGVGSSGVGLVNWSSGIAPLFLLGMGLGLTIPTTNLLISEMYPHKRAAALNLINLSWGVGAVTCPFLVAVFLRANRSQHFLYGVAVLLFILTSVLTRMPFSTVHVTNTRDSGSVKRAATWRSRYVPILGAIFFLYVGTEASIGGWIASYAKRTLPIGTPWVLTPSFFWASLLLGRSVSPVILRRVAESKLSQAGLILALAGTITAIAAGNTIQLAFGSCLAGLGLSSVFPIAIAALAHKFGEMATRVAGLMFNLAGLGGAALPWLVGFTSARFGNLKFGLFVPLLGCATMLVLNFLLEPPSLKTPRT
jgi:FHS family glucose/mannose:H+ symporter-like MFS transporter